MVAEGELDLLRRQLVVLQGAVAVLLWVVTCAGLVHLRHRRRGGDKPSSSSASSPPGLPLLLRHPPSAAAVSSLPAMVPGGCVLNVLDFGAKADDTTDCTAPLQKAMDAMKDGDFLFFPAGTYKTTSTIAIGGRGGSVSSTSAAPPPWAPTKLVHGITIFGTRHSIIHHNPGVTGKGFGHRVWDVHGPRALIRDMCFANQEEYPHTGAGPNINVQQSAEFTELARLSFHCTGQNAMVVCCRGINIHDCVVTASPEHGVYLSGGSYNLQTPSDARIENNHFENIAKNGIQVQNANASPWVLEGTIISGNVFRNVHVGVFISESYVGLNFAMPIKGKPPLGTVKGSKSGAEARVDPGEWEAFHGQPGWARASCLASSYPAVFEVGETLTWSGGGSGVLAEVWYDKVSRCSITGNQFLRDDTIVPVPAPGNAMLPIAPQIGVTMGNSSSDIIVSDNIFRGMAQMAVCVNSSGAIDGCSGVSVRNNLIDGAGLGGLGVWFQKCEAVSICGNMLRGAPIADNGHAKNMLIQQNVTCLTDIPP